MRKIALLFAICFLQICTGFGQSKYEFRAAWIATVDNIDWPSKKGLSTDSQKVEYLRILDMHQRNGLNAVIVQIRPATDAMYPSQYEPWSEWLTGTQGKPPMPYYDPLQFMIEEAHKRGLEFHAWCNPYRAEFSLRKSSIAPTHITRIHPEWFLTYGNTRYFDPGNKQAQEFVVRVIRDIVSRYNIDAVHFDDYFYPYRIAGKEFPDSMSYAQYGNGMSKDDWRRSNVDSIIVKLGRAIKEENKHCRFGISPFGVWRNKNKDPEGSDTRAGQTNYDDLYADILLWLKNGWIDYVAPQLYWEFTQPNAPYGVLLDWWSKHTYGRHCYIGLGMYRAGSSAAWKDSTLIPRQIQALRDAPNVQGAIYFSSKSFIRNPNGWNDSLQNNYYRRPALIPPMEWIDSSKPARPVVKVVPTNNEDNSIELELSIAEPDASIKAFVVYTFNIDTQGYLSPNIYRVVHSSQQARITIPLELAGKTVAFTCVNKNNNESELEFLVTSDPISSTPKNHDLLNK
ncbi:MAG TPA: family 10 glycosylhydrolase [Chitinophagaceae bacterium]|nr:family 10 glycosylhydrolase [Chitinophagaceae bacterium]